MALSALEMLSRNVDTSFDDGLADGLGGYWNLVEGDEPGVFEIFTEEYGGDADKPGLAIGQRWRLTVEEITG